VAPRRVGVSRRRFGLGRTARDDARSLRAAARSSILAPEPASSLRAAESYARDGFAAAWLAMTLKRKEPGPHATHAAALSANQFPLGDLP